MLLSTFRTLYKIAVLIYFANRSTVFCKTVALKNVSKFPGKYLCLQLATLLKKRLRHRCFPENFVKFLIARFCRTCLTSANDYSYAEPFKAVNVPNNYSVRVFKVFQNRHFKNTSVWSQRRINDSVNYRRWCLLQK